MPSLATRFQFPSAGAEQLLVFRQLTHRLCVFIGEDIFRGEIIARSNPRRLCDNSEEAINFKTTRPEMILEPTLGFRSKTTASL